MTLVLSGPDYPHRALANDAATTANDAGIFGGRDEPVVLAPGKTARIRRSDRRNGISRLSPRRHREYVSLDFDGWKTLCVAPLIYVWHMLFQWSPRCRHSLGRAGRADITLRTRGCNVDMEEARSLLAFASFLRAGRYSSRARARTVKSGQTSSNQRGVRQLWWGRPRRCHTPSACNSGRSADVTTAQLRFHRHGGSGCSGAGQYIQPTNQYSL